MANNPWANSEGLIKKIKSRIDHEAIGKITEEIMVGTVQKKKRLKGIYFDHDVVEILDALKKRRVNVSGFVNEAVRDWVEKDR